MSPPNGFAVERARFEQWARDEGYSSDALARVEDAEGAPQGYINPETVALFVGWMARARTAP